MSTSTLRSDFLRVFSPALNWAGKNRLDEWPREEQQE
jgi:hypothetical protein